MSRQTDPQQMVQQYGARMRRFRHVDRSISLAAGAISRPRRSVSPGSAVGTAKSTLETTGKVAHPQGGISAKLIYADEPRVINDFEVPPNDPAVSIF